MWALHPNVHRLLLAFDFDILLSNVPVSSGYLGPLDGVQGANSYEPIWTHFKQIDLKQVGP